MSQLHFSPGENLSWCLRIRNRFYLVIDRRRLFFSAKIFQMSTRTNNANEMERMYLDRKVTENIFINSKILDTKLREKPSSPLRFSLPLILSNPSQFQHLFRKRKFKNISK